MNEIDKNAIKDFFSKLVDFSDEEWNEYSKLLVRKKIAKKGILLQSGQYCKEVYWVEKGLLRIYFESEDGNEHTFHFAEENQFATDYKSLLKQTNANYSIQAIESSIIWVMSDEMLFWGYKLLRNGEKLGRLLAENHFHIFSDKLYEIYTRNPMERYNLMNKQYNKILSRIPQHYIASYLNISSVHLSRLKNKK